MNKHLFVYPLLCILLFSISCKKGPGQGGQATIKGHVTGILYNKNFTTKLDSGAVGNWTVNILYGDDLGVDANQKTDYNGSFEFQYLRTGHYTVFLYSRAHKTNQTDSSIVISINIAGKKQLIELPEIKILR